ncbi:leucine-rich repeats and immunoglobulin-like domains protein 2 [Aplysia californica]|uniref:Leucine-rich repeats and immunoglobulin-like domains protein 2 n=1 Tax=Aplysia californica TaxID=6500 RepID=A0ABM1A7V0_APLCA|nr:leucine-rich repeats and immunoglobulin-like domains protein 2 [Aplysia californica]
MAAVLLSVCSAFVVWVCCSVQPVVAESVRCPSSCACLGNNVDCSNIGLINIPKDIPVWATRLELQSNGITEIRQDDLKGLPNLQYLDLSSNDIKVINGSVFRDLTGLLTLKLDSNELTEIPQFPIPLNITELSITQNHVVKIPLTAMSRMPELLTLDLSNNYILSIENGSFHVGSKLTHLNMNGNQIAALDIGCMSNLTFLETLKMNKNKVMELPQEVFSGLSSLKTLELMRNKIKVIKGLTFQGLKELQSLKLKRNSISVLKDGAFWGLSNIVNLHMDHNDITNITKGWLFGLKTLKHLSLGHNKISKIEGDAWEPCKHLEKLDLAHNRLTALTEHTLTHLASLKHLFLDHNQISRIDEGAFRDLPELNVLELNANEISWTMEDVSGAFRGLTSLTTLGLRANAVRSIAVHAFSGLPRLRHLHLEDNDITSIQENAFETLRDLRDLQFNSSKLFCDCHLSWLPPWLKQNGFQHSAIGVCFYPQLLRGAALSQIDVADFKCNNAEFPKPVILESPKSANGSKGENMTLNCVTAITGDSQLSILWKKDNVMLDEMLSEVTATSDGEVKRFTSHLHLRDIEDSMAGRYQCVVSNEFGKVFSQRAYVKVYVYPMFLKRPKDVTVKAGKPAELKCAATGQPAPVISWQKDGGDNFPAARERRMRVYPNDDRFYILNTRVADEGIYSCMARNDAGVVITNATVTVLETPDFVQPMQVKKSTKRGETTVLQCMASGSPQPKLTWLKDDKELVMTPRHFFTVDNQLLVIVDTQWSDAGIYACRMSNSLGTAKGATELQVLSTSGEVHEPGGSSFGLDDESTTTGIIIIAVVCCVVGTSLVWVIIIYQTRKRHEVYSATPTDETTLPGEVPSSGYMSSDKEGSYSQGPITMGGYHYQDYQMKESGYESSSGQFRANGYARPAVCPSDVDEDDNHPPTLTAGDRLLRKMNSAHSAASLQYPGSDGDTIGSRHSTSSGQHSGSSDPPSSHSGHSVSPLVVATAPACDDYWRNPSPAFPSPGSDEPRDFSESHASQLHQPQLLSPEGRPLLQTFHPTKMSHHEKLGTANTLGNKAGVGWSRGGSRGGLEGGGRCGGVYSRQRHHSDSCDNRDIESPSPPLPHCAGCGHHAWPASTTGANSNSMHGHPNGRTEIHHPSSNHIPCRMHDVDAVNSDKSDSVGAGSKRQPRSDSKPPVNPSSAISSSSQGSERKGRSPPTYSEVCGIKGNPAKGHHPQSSRSGEGLDNRDNSAVHARLHHYHDSGGMHCSECDNVYPLPSKHATPSSSSPRVATPTPCCCEVMRDPHYCPSPHHPPQHSSRCCEKNMELQGRRSGPHRGPVSMPPHRHKGGGKKVPVKIERSRSSSSVGQEPLCYAQCDTYSSAAQPDCVSCSCNAEHSSFSTSPMFQCAHCPDCQSQRDVEQLNAAYSRPHRKGTPSSSSHSHNVSCGSTSNGHQSPSSVAPPPSSHTPPLHSSIPAHSNSTSTPLPSSSSSSPSLQQQPQHKTGSDVR